MGKSCAWVHYLAAGKWDRIGVTREHAKWLAALYVLERGRSKAANDETDLIADIREHLAQAIGRTDELARRIAARRRKPSK